MNSQAVCIVWIATVALLGILACEDQDELARVNGQSISNTQFQAYLKFKRVPDKAEDKKQKILDDYLQREALASAIEKEKLLDQELIEAELNEFRKEMLISRYFERFLKENVTDEAIQNYYNTNPDQFEENKIRVAHILIRTNKRMSEVEKKAKRTTAQEVYSKIASGMAFEGAAKNYSEDRISSKKGGDLGWIKQGGVDPRFSAKVFSMKPDTISEPFETAFGFHIVKVLEGPMTVKKPLAAVKGDIRYQLRNKAKKAEMERLVAKIKMEKKQGVHSTKPQNTRPEEKK